jgi:hypothetical protein
MLCCQGFEVKNYDFTLGRLACESLRPVQDPGINIKVLFVSHVIYTSCVIRPAAVICPAGVIYCSFSRNAFGYN